ncbi:MAG: hypothetical protein NW226_01960 [Microscillaceae bacterium]|nr:hypothetical protein [Microscillaceae bacterium]
MLFIIIALLVFITQTIFYHWWLVAVDAFVAALFFGRSGWVAFLSGFMAVGLVWFIQAYYLSQRNEGLLLERMTKFFGFLPSSEWMFVLTVAIGALVGGFSALTAYSIRSFWKK